MLQRVQKIIANSGVCSRRKAEELIKQGKVKVNDQVIKIGSSADPMTDVIIVDGKSLQKVNKQYYAFNKPPDCLTTLHDPKGRKTILNYINLKDRVIPVGRLDFKTQGLLFLTNDGDFANHVMHPRYEVKKKYMVFTDRPVELKDVRQLKEGIDLGDVKTRPAEVKYLSPRKDVIEVGIHQGNNRIVRRMMKHIGYNLKRLIRTNIGDVALGNLPVGNLRKLTPEEVKQFYVFMK